MDSFFLRVLSKKPLSVEVLGSDRIKLKHKLEDYYLDDMRAESLRHSLRQSSYGFSDLLHLASRELVRMFHYDEVQVSLQVGLLNYTILFRGSPKDSGARKSRFERVF
jgi:hypothetical protein